MVHPQGSFVLNPEEDNDKKAIWEKQVFKAILPLALLLHEGTPVNLSKLVLANLYESLDDAVATLSDPTPITLINGPFWLLQLWFNAVKLNSIDFPVPSDM